MKVIDPTKIIVANFNTLIKEDMYLPMGIFLFYIIPIVISLGFVIFITPLTKDMLNPILTSISILTGFILALLAILIDQNPNNSLDLKNLLRNLSYNCMYSLLLGILILVVAFIAYSVWDMSTDIIKLILSILILALLTHLLLMMLVVLKRIFVIFENKFK